MRKIWITLLDVSSRVIGACIVEARDINHAQQVFGTLGILTGRVHKCFAVMIDLSVPGAHKIFDPLPVNTLITVEQMEREEMYIPVPPPQQPSYGFAVYDENTTSHTGAKQYQLTR